MKNINSYFQSTHNSCLDLSFPGLLPCIQNSNQTGFIYQPTNYVEHLYKSRTLVGIWLWIHWVSYNCSSTECVTNYRLSLISILGITWPSYIVGLTCTRLGDKIVNVVIPATVSNNTALIMTSMKLIAVAPIIVLLLSTLLDLDEIMLKQSSGLVALIYFIFPQIQ